MDLGQFGAKGPRRAASGILVAALSVALTTLTVSPWRRSRPRSPLAWLPLRGAARRNGLGRWLGIATAVASALAFDFFHIQPTGRFTIGRRALGGARRLLRHCARWPASSPSAPAIRRTGADERRREADCRPRWRACCCGLGTSTDALARRRDRISTTLGLPSASIEVRARRSGPATCFPAARGFPPARAPSSCPPTPGARCAGCRSASCRRSKPCSRRPSSAISCSQSRGGRGPAMHRVLKTALPACRLA